MAPATAPPAGRFASPESYTPKHLAERILTSKVYLPTFAGPHLDFDQAALVKDFARKAEDLGFDALWVAEHFLEAPGLYGTVWMSPLLCLAHAASVTTRIRLATGLLILPYYHPVMLAREIQTLWHLSGGRFVLESDRAGTSTSSRRSA